MDLTISAYKAINGLFDYNATPLAPLWLQDICPCKTGTTGIMGSTWCFWMVFRAGNRTLLVL
jgi:hypothetical protein